jgi:hypothetical protein
MRGGIFSAATDYDYHPLFWCAFIRQSSFTPEQVFRFPLITRLTLVHRNEQPHYATLTVA